MWGIFDKKEPEETKEEKGFEIVETDKPFLICFEGIVRGYIDKDDQGIHRAVFTDTSIKWAQGDLYDIVMKTVKLNKPLEGEINE